MSGGDSCEENKIMVVSQDILVRVEDVPSSEAFFC